MQSKLLILHVILLFLLSCKDEGKPIPVADRTTVDPENAFALIQRFKNPPNMHYSHGENVCFGEWSFNVYKRCEHKFHAGDNFVNKLTMRLTGVRADSEDEALNLCTKYVQALELPVGVSFTKYSVKIRGGKVYDCFAVREIEGNHVSRTQFCGLDTSLDFSSKGSLPEDLKFLGGKVDVKADENGVYKIPFLGIDIGRLRLVTGFHNFTCSTCDHLPVNSHKQLMEKFFCLMDRFLKLEEDKMISIQNQINRDILNFDNTTSIPFEDEEDTSGEDELLDLLDDENGDLETDETEQQDDSVDGDDDLVKNPEVIKESPEDKKLRERKELMKKDVMNSLVCLKKYYSSVMDQRQNDGIKRIEEKYKLQCEEG